MLESTNVNHRLISRISCILDLVVFFLSYYLSVYIKFNFITSSYNAKDFIWNKEYLVVASIFSILMILIYYLNGLYEIRKFNNIEDKIYRIIILNVVGIFIVTVFLYFTRYVEFSRITLVLYYIISTIFISLKYLLMRLVSSSYYDKIYKNEKVVVVGNGNLAKKYIESTKKPGMYVDVFGYISKVEKNGLGKCLGSYEELANIIEEYGIDSIIIALESHETKYMPMILEACEKNGTKIHVIPFYSDYMPKKSSIVEFGDVKLLNLRTIPLDEIGNSFIKRTIDIIISSILIIITSPIMLFAVIGIKITMPGPIFFKQKRVGKDKKEFTMYKFRSMKVDSNSDKAWSKQDDNRRTKFGKLIRKLSIDELPQLFNVLKGDMSLIGPRPEIPYYVYKFKESVPLYLVRQQVRPGMTGLAQINGLRGDTSIEERVKYDIDYIENWTLGLDAKIFLKTVFGGFINKEKL